MLEASREILAALFAAAPGERRRAFAADAAFEQSLTIVYRVLFLLFAEARGLVPAWHRVYRDSYTIEALAAAAARGEPAEGAALIARWTSPRGQERAAGRGGAGAGEGVLREHAMTQRLTCSVGARPEGG